MLILWYSYGVPTERHGLCYNVFPAILTWPINFRNDLANSMLLGHLTTQCLILIYGTGWLSQTHGAKLHWRGRSEAGPEEVQYSEDNWH